MGSIAPIRRHERDGFQNSTSGRSKFVSCKRVGEGMSNYFLPYAVPVSNPGMDVKEGLDGDGFLTNVGGRGIKQTSLKKMFQCQYQGHGKALTSMFLLVILLCSGGIQIVASTASQQPPSSPSSSTNSAQNSARTFDNVNNPPPSPSSHNPGLSQQSSSSSLSSLPVRAVSTRPTSDISTTNSGDNSENSVPSHYDACPNGEPWCSSLDENEKLALEAIHALHHQLDDDKNGNIDLFESNEFLREELKYDRDYEKRQENFHRNNDNQVSVKELWETWVRSEVHNWTVDQTAEWIGDFVGLPLYQEKFIQLSINGTYLPRLAVNHHNFLSTNLGIKDVITRQKLTLKAQDVVLFGSPRDNTNRAKDIFLTSSLVVALTVCYLVFVRYKSSQRDLSRMSKDMEALMKAEETLRDLQKEMEQVKCDQEVREKEVTQRASSDDEDELIKLRGEVLVLRNELQRAEVELQDKCWVPPPALTHWLQLTYELESKAHNKKRQSAEKQLKQAKEACDKLKKKRSSLMGAFVATHARSIDDVDKAILEARAALTEVTQELQERMHRWKQIEMLVKSPIVNNPGLANLEILLRSGARSTPYLGMGTGSVMSNSQDDIDDDGASSIYCPSAVHKLISNSAFMMFPGQIPTPISSSSAQSNTRTYQQQSSSDYSSLTNYGGDSCRPSQSPDIARRERANNLAHNHAYQNDNCSTTDFADCIEVSGPITNLHTPIARSKSVQSMLSLRGGGGYHRESSSKDSSNGDDDILGDAAEMMTAKDRRVTFRAAAADRRSGQMRSLQGRTNGPIYEPMEFEDTRNFYSRKPMSANRLENSKSSEEENHRKMPSTKEEPDLIKLSNNSNSLSHHQSLEACSNHKTEIDNDFICETKHPTKAESQSQTSETNMLLLNNKTPEKTLSKEDSTTTITTATTPPSSKQSFLKTISKLMRIQSDGLTTKKTKKSKEVLPQNNAGDTDGKLHNNPMPNKNNVITEKNLLPTYTDEDNNTSTKSQTLKLRPQQKRSHKFFASLRRKTGENSSAELIST